jgi:prepilin-type N-terminal cleavage/methylation domain-containing protein
MKAGRFYKMQGFSLIEMTMALLLLSSGILAAGQLIYAAVSSGSLARSKMTAAIAAQDKIEYLSALYAQNPIANELTAGDHGPQQANVINPIDGSALNNFNVTWNISEVEDPRPGKTINSKRVRVVIIPQNKLVRFNKVLQVTAILSPKMIW